MTEDRNAFHTVNHNSSAVAEELSAASKRAIEAVGNCDGKTGRQAELGWPAVLETIAEEPIRQLRPQNVLDAACGPGLLVKALRETDGRCMRLDISEEAIATGPPDDRPYCAPSNPTLLFASSTT